MACNCISRVEKMVKEKTNESGRLDTSIGIPSGIAMVNVYGLFHKPEEGWFFLRKVEPGKYPPRVLPLLRKEVCGG